TYACDPDTRLLLGTSYVLLRREFMKFNNWERKIRDTARRFLVTLGGSDPSNTTEKVLHALGLIRMDGAEVRIVLGPANPFGKKIEEEAKRMPFEIQLLSSVKDMSELMAWADIAVSAGGSTCWEMAYMGLIETDDLALKIQSLAEDFPRRAAMSRIGRRIVDGKGADRIIDALSGAFREGGEFIS
ncbi:MAG: hypothetical protein JRJ62_13675, partial [Deltaproteobacteria bacterium]|nr:hypothetical protein [Deltaproteobacteria bacterium]